MHPHTRRKTKKRLGRLTPRGKTLPAMPAAEAPAVVPLANDDERSCLANDLACIRAARYRDVTFTDVREEDVERADTEIAALFKCGDPE